MDFVCLCAVSKRAPHLRVIDRYGCWQSRPLHRLINDAVLLMILPQDTGAVAGAGDNRLPSSSIITHRVDKDSVGFIKWTPCMVSKIYDFSIWTDGSVEDFRINNELQRTKLFRGDHYQTGERKLGIWISQITNQDKASMVAIFRIANL